MYRRPAENCKVCQRRQIGKLEKPRTLEPGVCIRQQYEMEDGEGLDETANAECDATIAPHLYRSC